MTMQLKQISSWKTFDSIHKDVKDEYVKSWLLEKGPITNRISINKSFNLELLSDAISNVLEQDQLFLASLSKEFKVREVILHGDGIPMVFARTIIPLLTIQDGLAELGELGQRPLGDILFEKIYLRKKILYIHHLNLRKIFFGEEK